MKGRTMPRNSQKGVQRPLSEVCCDCGSSDANWASVNRGVLMCNDCASVHMGLGRHISQVKHMQKSHWHPNLLSMVQHLVSSGANSIWEHSLLDPAQMRSGKRKPNPNDNVHPTKAEFIKSKYLNLLYVHRLAMREEDDISKQLHSSVRTGNLETSLRLLSHGAHADFFNTEKGNTPLHVAAKCGQSMQVELLVVYGADPGTRDSNGKTAEDLARAENHIDLADRLVELQYEVSDKFVSFVCGDIPDHKSGKHYILPKIKEPVLMSQEGKKRLAGLSNQTFEVLAMDIYDEVERRELERIWQDVQKNVLIPGKASNPALQTEVVPFLPLHPEYSSTRNQGRQKLAHFKDAELNNLICDIINEITRREKIFGPITPVVPEEDPIYDEPPDEDEPRPQQRVPDNGSVEPPKEMVSKEEFLALKKIVEEKETEILKLREQNRGLSSKATELARENHELNRKVQKLTEFAKVQSQSQASFVRVQSPNARPSSFYNPNDSSGSQSSLHSAEGSDFRRYTIHPIVVDQKTSSGGDGQSTGQSAPKKGTKIAVNSSQCSSSSEYDNNNTSKEETATPEDDKSNSEKKSDTSQPSVSSNNNNNNASTSATPSASQEQDAHDPVEPKAGEQSENAPPSGSEASGSPNSQIDIEEEELTWPENHALKKKTDYLTRMIQTLHQTAQTKKVDSYLECAEKILSAVADVVALFDKPHMPPIKSVLQQLCGSAHKLRSRCKESLDPKSKAESHRQLTEEIISYAYEIAKAEKHLVMMAPKDESDTGSAV